tara:strand:+ start:1193 stop:1549 length:357 start_codon:yes stop_codon:yes gene_type:complete
MTETAEEVPRKRYFLKCEVWNEVDGIPADIAWEAIKEISYKPGGTDIIKWDGYGNLFHIVSVSPPTGNRDRKGNLCEDIFFHLEHQGPLFGEDDWDYVNDERLKEHFRRAGWQVFGSL